jgi:DNA-directed RNA polymerase specialized sigma24 family protein
MNPDQILDIAHHAIHATMRPSSGWSWDDRDDAAQEAALAICKAIRSNSDRGYLYGAAKLAIYLWMRNTIRYRQRVLLVRKMEFVNGTLEDVSLIERLLRSLPSREMKLIQQRLKRGKNLNRRVQTDLDLLRLVLEGYSFDEIAFRLALTRP